MAGSDDGDETVASERTRGHVGAIALAGWQLTAGGLVLLVPVLLIEGMPAHVDGGALARYAWLGIVGGLLAYTVWFAGVQRLPAVASALLGLLSPLVAALLGALVLGEAFAPVQAAGFAVALIAMLAGQIAPRPRRHARSEVPDDERQDARAAPAGRGST